MPRQPRLDAPGLLHHIIARGIERREIFHSKTDYEDFLARLEATLEKSPNQILAWALMPNHFHILVRSGPGGIVRFMRRLMSGYAVAFNARHKRSGYLFQNRYKSIVCEEETYLLELVRYIHLNPLRAGLVKSLEALRRFPYTGHGVLMGVQKRPWQETEDVLDRFGKEAGSARRRYEAFVAEAQGQGLRPDLTGGGLLRSQGGLSAALMSRRGGAHEPADTRILGSGSFVQTVWREAERKEKIKTRWKKEALGLEQVGEKVAAACGVNAEELYQRGRKPAVSQAKALFIFASMEYLGETVSGMAQRTRMSQPAASKARSRGAGLAEQPEIKKVLTEVM